jgi:hypothetical protein
MRLFTNKIQWSGILKIAGTLMVLMIVACYDEINTVVQPSTVTGGQALNVTLTGQWNSNNPLNNANFVVAILVPTIWNAAENATITFTCDLTNGTQGMSPIPAGTQSPGGGGLDWPTDLANVCGHEGNLIPEWEWVAFQSNTPISIGENVTSNFTVNISIKTGAQSLYFNMGYVTADNQDGLHNMAFTPTWEPNAYYSVSAPEPITVNGTGTLLDFVNPQLSVAVPATATDNDIVQIPFGANTIANALSSAGNMYLCATGYVHGGDSIQVCQQTVQSRLDSVSAGNWQIDIWPRGFFNLAATQTLDSMHYFFTDPSGTIKVGNGGSSSSPFSYSFGCQ